MTAAGAPQRTAAAGPRRAAVGLGTQTLVLAGSLARSWARQPGIAIQAVVFPAFLLLMFQTVLGRTVDAMGGGESVYRNAGLIALIGVMYGSLATGIGLITERESGLLARQWTLPVPRAGFLAGRLLAELARALVSTAVLFGLAVCLGFRFSQGFAAGIGAFVVPVAFAAACALGIIAMATVTSEKQIVQVFGALFLLAMFFNTGFVPLDQYPGWLQPVVRWQPMSPAIDLMRGLTEGGAVAVPLAASAAWIVVIALLGGIVAARGFRHAATAR
ncbi:ABC transporter permease [Tsukamurella sp. 8F]|uniref:ABC transporter permease n=1 Tax=unclassified Tsukamurella TaxID=2633480 RepID=UPI0023B98157|nr:MULTISPECIES: ABC transporter permease [unclassified Tsukamurella]MDF0529314.1 ABC transporter permease [Tsukamurella sp. 8J]MDF0587179.1 ABC transporter permease [Tsukamurella sp. 8F]